MTDGTETEVAAAATDTTQVVVAPNGDVPPPAAGTSEPQATTPSTTFLLTAAFFVAGQQLKGKRKLGQGSLTMLSDGFKRWSAPCYLDARSVASDVASALTYDVVKTHWSLLDQALLVNVPLDECLAALVEGAIEESEYTYGNLSCLSDGVIVTIAPAASIAAILGAEPIECVGPLAPGNLLKVALTVTVTEPTAFAEGETEGEHWMVRSQLTVVVVGVRHIQTALSWGDVSHLASGETDGDEDDKAGESESQD